MLTLRIGLITSIYGDRLATHKLLINHDKPQAYSRDIFKPDPEFFEIRLI